MEEWELIAILLGSGGKGLSVEFLSRDLLTQFSGLSGLLDVSPSLLQKKKGIGKAKAATLAAIKEIVLRVKIASIQSEETTDFKSIQEYIYYKSRSEVRESFYLITLDSKKKLIHLDVLAKGGLSEVGIHPRDILKRVLDDGARYVIVAHNHPRATSLPSEEDYILFKKLQFLMEQIEVKLLDQWVSGTDGVFSCLEKKRILEV